MIRAAAWAALLLAMLLLTGCPRAWTLSLYNNSGADLAIVLPEGELPWKAGTVVDVVGTAATQGSGLHWVTDAQGIEIPVLKVRRGAAIASYRGVDYLRLPREYVDDGGAAIRQRLQLEPDGSLYLVARGASLPVHPPPSQPDGFPLKPARRSG